MTQEYLHASLESNIRSPRVSLHVYPACRAALSALRRLEPRLKGLCGSRAAGMPYAGCGCTVCDAHELPAARAAFTPATVVTAADREERWKGREDAMEEAAPARFSICESRQKYFFPFCTLFRSRAHMLCLSVTLLEPAVRPSTCQIGQVHARRESSRAGRRRCSSGRDGARSPAHAARAAVLLGHQRGACLAVRRDNAIRRSTRATLASVWLPLRTGAFRYR